MAVSTHRTDYVVTNDRTQDSTEATQEARGFHWKIEQLHREGNKLPAWNAASAARRASSATISAVLSWFGFDSKR